MNRFIAKIVARPNGNGGRGRSTQHQERRLGHLVTRAESAPCTCPGRLRTRSRERLDDCRHRGRRGRDRAHPDAGSARLRHRDPPPVRRRRRELLAAARRAAQARLDAGELPGLPARDRGRSARATGPSPPSRPTCGTAAWRSPARRPQDDHQRAQLGRAACSWRTSRTPTRRPGRTSSRARPT